MDIMICRWGGNEVGWEDTRKWTLHQAQAEYIIDGVTMEILEIFCDVGDYRTFSERLGYWDNVFQVEDNL